MKVAVLSGKGGTGKTFVSVNLAAAAKSAVYIDCDVEEPNGRLFLKPEEPVREEVSVLIPESDPERCTGCRECVRFCRFNALAYLRGRIKVFREVCHSCGGCLLTCKAGALREEAAPVGFVETGRSGAVTVVTGELNTGEASGVPVIRAALRKGLTQEADTVIIDCPPGSACSVTESISRADCCLLVAEPTAFGLHNLRMAAELVRISGKPCGVVINKSSGEYPPLENFCKSEGLPVLLRIPYSREMAALLSGGGVAAREDADAGKMFRDLLEQIGGIR